MANFVLTLENIESTIGLFELERLIDGSVSLYFTILHTQEAIFSLQYDDWPI